MEINQIYRDMKLVEEGMWIDEIPNLGEVRLKVRGLKSRVVATIMARKERKLETKDRERDGSPKPEARMRIFGETLHEVVLLDWEGILLNGEPVPYDRELALELLTNPKSEDFADAVAWAAKVVDREAQGKTETIAGN